MKNTIIVGTDFSENSINALKHATTIADKTKCNITLLWVETPGTTLGLMSDNVVEYRQIAEKRLADIAKDHSHLMSDGFKIIPKILAGRPFKVMAKEAEEVDALMIVVGAHGVSGYEEAFIGNTAYRIVMNAKCPVLIIQNETNISRALTDIVVLIDSSNTTLHKLPFAIKMAKLFNAKINLLGLYTSSSIDLQAYVDNHLSIADKFLRDSNVRYSQTTLESFNMTSTVTKFAEQIDANLVVIMSEQDDFGSWLGDTSREMINKLKVPVLCIHPNDKVYDISR